MGSEHFTLYIIYYLVEVEDGDLADLKRTLKHANHANFCTFLDFVSNFLCKQNKSNLDCVDFLCLSMSVALMILYGWDI